MPNHNQEQNLIQQEHIQVTTDLETMDQVLQWFKQFSHPPLTSEIWMQGQIALIEGFTNAVQHAHKNLPASTPVDLRVKVFSHQLEISIWDEGLPFDLEALLADLEQHHHDPLAREAHWGGVLIKRLRDKHNWSIFYTYDTVTQRNCLMMKKALTESPTKSFPSLAH